MVDCQKTRHSAEAENVGLGCWAWGVHNLVLPHIQGRRQAVPAVCWWTYRVGADRAVARPFMLRWDKMYLHSVKKAGIEMKLYERYVDDSDQVAEVPPPGARYDREKKRL